MADDNIKLTDKNKKTISEMKKLIQSKTSDKTIEDTVKVLNELDGNLKETEELLKPFDFKKDDFREIKGKNYKSHSGKPYLSKLPYDLRISDVDKLQERVDAIDERIAENEELIGSELWIQEDRQNAIDELEEKNKDWQSRLDDYALTEAQFETYNQGMQEEGLDAVEKITGEIRSILDGTDYLKAVVDGEPNIFYESMSSLSEVFEYGGVLTGNQAEEIRFVAGQLWDIYNSTYGEYELDNVIKDLNNLADKHDINKNKNAWDALADVRSFSDDKITWQEELDKNNEEIRRSQEVIEDSKKVVKELETENSNYKEERKKTTDRIKEVKKGK